MRRTPRPFGTTIRPTRVVSLLLGVALLWMVYDRVKDPKTFGFLDRNAKSPVMVAQLPGEAPPAEEIVIPGPNDTDQDEVLDNADKFDAVQDRKELIWREMPAYWKLLEWSRTQPLAELEKRARRDVLMAHLWNTPQKHKGRHPIRLRLDIVRCLPWDGESNPLGIQRVVEAWGTDEDSRGNPYCVVLADPPPDLPIGANVSARLEFTGYFLKNMVYDTYHGQRRGAPLLLGRARTVAVPKVARASDKSNTYVTMFVAAAALGCAAVVGFLFFRPRKSKRAVRDQDKALPDSLSLEPDFDAPTSRGFADGMDDGEFGGDRRRNDDRSRDRPACRVDFDGIVLGEYQSPGPTGTAIAVAPADSGALSAVGQTEGSPRAEE